MITFEQVQQVAKPHGSGNGKHATFETDKHVVSVVGGRQGLYGDFEKLFEVAIIDKETREFVSGKYFPQYSDKEGQVMPYITKEQMLEVVNRMVV